MGKKCCILIVLLSAFTIGTIFAKDIVVCGTVTDVSAPGANAAALPCSVSVHAGCSAADGDLYFAKTNTKGYYSLTVSLPENCTDTYLFIFNGKRQNRSIATVQVNMPQSGVADTLRQNLQLTIIDEAMPAVDSIPKEILDDWKAQGGTADSIEASLPAEYAAKCDGTFESACHWRRVYRMSQFPQMQSIMFARHHNMGTLEIGSWVNVPDVTDTYFQAKGALCLLKFKDYYSQYTEILTKNDACVRDPCISLDGKKVIFAMSGIGKYTGYRLFEMNIDDSGSVKQLTQNPADLTVADFEPCYLPNGDIVFASTRCFGVSHSGWQPTTNMFIMDSTGKYMRRAGFDQALTCYPVLRGDGTVMYSRWEQNDRDIANIMGLFRMNPDGSHQTELFGNQTTWPMTIIQGRPVPGNPKLFFAIAGGHHGDYSGEVCVIDVTQNSNGPENVTMVSPPRTTETRDTNDIFAWGGIFRNSEYPYPLNDKWYLVGYREDNSMPSMMSPSNNTPFRIYLKNIDGTSRELLAWGDQSLHSPVVVAPWKDIWGSEPFRVEVQANYNDSLGIFTMQDVYKGQGLKDVTKGVAKKLRVVALMYRVTGACENGWAGQLAVTKPSDIIFSAPVRCPVSLWGGSWDVKKVLGEAMINEDGSAAFKVPARTPVYFQVLDSNGCSIASMRSWSTLMPGETFSCVGCHESKAEAPPAGNTALAGTAKPLEKLLGVEDRGFDYPTFVQPILDEHCVSCHRANHASGLDLTGDLVLNSSAKKSFAKSYTSLFTGIGASKSNRAINIATVFSQAPQMPPYSYGSTQSGMIKAINGSVAAMKDVNLTDREKRILACWIDLEAPHSGAYYSYMSTPDSLKYQDLVSTAQKWHGIEAQNVKDLAALQAAATGPGQRAKASASDNRFSIGYLPRERALVLNRPDRGSFVLVDLRGRVIYRTEIADRHTDNISISLPPSLSRGCYAALFIGEGLTLQRMVTVIR